MNFLRSVVNHFRPDMRFLLLGFLGVALVSHAQQVTRAEALALEQAQHTAEAEQLWNALSIKSPEDPEPLAHLGLLEARQEHYEAAIGFYRRALQLNPDLPGLQMNLGLALFKAAQFPQAIQSFRTELKKHPGDQRLTILLGMAHYGMGDYLVAIPYLRQASVRDVQNLPLRLALAHSCLWSKQYDCVMEVEKQILSLNAESAEADMLAGEALDETGDDAGAIAQFRNAARANPKEPSVHFGLGYLLWKLKQFEESAKEFQAELDNDPQHTMARAYLGDVYTVQADYAKAEPELRKALEGSSTSAMVHRDLGIVYAATARPELAVKELQQAIALDPQDVAAHWRIARLYQSIGKKDDARSEFAIASRMNQATHEALTQKIGNAQPAKP
jgi:tetratricopeptide (TPR) repeat protein